jgi:Zn-dependent protease
MLDLITALFSWVALIFIFTFHNYLKALTAVKLGDDTPRREGFLTVNPIVHLDPIGTVLVPGILLLLGSKLLIGWPRVVPLNYNAFKNPTRAALIIALVSIFSYFLIALFGLGVYKLVDLLNLPSNVLIPLQVVFQFVFVISVFFGFLNLLPIPPFDLGVILLLLIGKDIHEIQTYSFWGMLIVLFLFVSGILDKIFHPIWLILQSFL